MLILVVGRGFPNKKNPLYGIFELDQAKALSSYGHKVVYASIDLRSIRRIRKFGFDHFVSDGIDIYRCSLPLGRVKDSLLTSCGRYGFSKIYKKIVRRFGKPDIVHAHFGDIASYVADVCKKSGQNLVITEHSSSVNVPSLPVEYKNKLTKTYQSADAVIAVGSALAKNITLHTGIVPTVIPNIVVLDSFHLAAERKDKSVFRFISAGNLIHSKGFDVLLRAFAEVYKTRKNICLTIMGGGAELDALKRLCSELGIDSSVSFTGKYVRKDFSSYLEKSDAFVLSSRTETFGVVYIEAMASGLPVIATSCGGPEDFVNEKNGILVPVDDVQALKDAMEHMCCRSEEYNSSSIRENAIKQFSDTEIATSITKIYRQILERRQN